VTGIAALGASVVQHLRAPDKPIAAAASEDDEEGGDPPRLWNRLFLGATLSLLYIGSLSVIGFLIATPIFLVALGFLMRSERPYRDAIAGVGLTIGIWLMFTRLLYVSLP
jgi:putative tricarboxylic transport membrane protein